MTVCRVDHHLLQRGVQPKGALGCVESVQIFMGLGVPRRTLKQVLVANLLLLHFLLC